MYIRSLPIIDTPQSTPQQTFIHTSFRRFTQRFQKNRRGQMIENIRKEHQTRNNYMFRVYQRGLGLFKGFRVYYLQRGVMYTGCTTRGDVHTNAVARIGKNKSVAILHLTLCKVKEGVRLCYPHREPLRHQPVKKRTL